MTTRLIFSLFIFLSACSNSNDASNAPTEKGLWTMTATELAEAVRSGDVTSEAIVTAHLHRIEALDRNGPTIQSVISLNPNALAEARALDAEAAAGQFRGALHGIPILVKDNIETRELPTTAGSLALAENNTGRDSPIIARLRDQGAIILGKTNLSEWANYRSNNAIAGWSGIGGQTRNPHSLDRSPSGSSAGSGAAVAAYFAPLALGTETNGSITSPAAANGIVGFKPTVGLLPRTHIVPLAPSQDSAGPMTRTVRDAALMLSLMAGSDETDPATQLADEKKSDYLRALDRNLDGMRIGVFRWAEGDTTEVSAAFNEALSVLEAEGAVLVEINEFSPDPIMWTSGDFILKTEFKHYLNAYLADAAPEVDVRTLSDLIAFNKAHADRELVFFDQSILLDTEEAKGIDDPVYIDAVAAIRQAAGKNGIDRLLKDHDVEVLVQPSGKLPTPIDVAYTTRGAAGLPVGATWLGAMAGYPALSVPMGEYRGLPLGLLIMGTAWDDGTVLAVGHAYENAADHQLKPSYASGPFDMPATADALRPCTDGCR